MGTGRQGGSMWTRRGVWESEVGGVNDDVEVVEAAVGGAWNEVSSVRDEINEKEARVGKVRDAYSWNKILERIFCEEEAAELAVGVCNSPMGTVLVSLRGRIGLAVEGGITW